MEDTITPMKVSDSVWLVPCLMKAKENTFMPLAKPFASSVEWHHVQTRQPWQCDEDRALKEIVYERGPRAWSSVARELNSRVHKGVPVRQGKQCRERYYNHIDSNLVKGNWTPEEDQHIVSMQQKIGNRWSEIAKKLKGRTENQVKNRFKSLLKKGFTENQIITPIPSKHPSAFRPYVNNVKYKIL